MPLGELVFANLVDLRVYQGQGRDGAPGIYVVSLPGRALPFVAYRAWKVPTGFVGEEIRLTAPSGVVAYRWGPNIRRMVGAMDLTVETDVIEDAVLSEAGAYLASFILEDQVLGEVEVRVYLQSAPATLPKHVEDGLKRSDVIWVGVEGSNGQRPKTIPAWFVYRQGRIYLVSQLEPGPNEQTVPGVPGASELVVITRRKGRDTSLDRFHASVRVLEPGQPEYDQAIKLLADRRRSRFGPPEESIARWRQSCVIAELTPVVSV
ncbi:MAG: hypothetical protein M3Q23_11160 [Actinomycetota bacterium]|nr:hypothetical protein [Actinomycetota bacterium]